MVDFLVCAHGLVDGRSNDSDVPDYQSLLSEPLYEPILLQQVLDQTSHSICEAVFVAAVTEFDIEVTARPVLENEIPDAYLLCEFALADV